MSRPGSCAGTGTPQHLTVGNTVGSYCVPGSRTTRIRAGSGCGPEAHLIGVEDDPVEEGDAEDEERPDLHLLEPHVRERPHPHRQHLYPEPVVQYNSGTTWFSRPRIQHPRGSAGRMRIVSTCVRNPCFSRQRFSRWFSRPVERAHQEEEHEEEAAGQLED